VKRVEVHWDDAWATTDETTVKKARKLKPVRTFTIGYLMAENEHGVIVAADTYKKHKKDGKVHNLIPWGCITGYWELVDG